MFSSMRLCKNALRFQFAAISRALHSSAEPVIHASSLDGANTVKIWWGAGTPSAFHTWWLRVNIPSSLHKSGQRTFSVASIDPKTPLVSVVPSADGRTLDLAWSDGTEASFSAAYLQAHDCASEALTNWRYGSRPKPLSAEEAVPSLPFSDFMKHDTALYAALEALNKTGIVLVTGLPCEATHPPAVWDAALPELARRIAPISHGFLYGDIFELKAESEARNMAYTKDWLPLHQDLIYYESAPGIQILHCIQLDESISGGSMTFMDAFGAVEHLKDTHPNAFENLKRIPATFIKSRSGVTDMSQVGSRDFCGHATHIYTQRPHIQTDAYGDVLSVSWSPPFEGPLRVPIDEVEDYQEAYSLLDEIIEGGRSGNRAGYAMGHTVRLRLKPGEAVVFNNRRMLHGRDAFDGRGVRLKHGCYLNVDEAMSRYWTLKTALSQQSTPSTLASLSQYLTTGADTVARRVGGEIRMGTSTLPCGHSHRHSEP